MLSYSQPKGLKQWAEIYCLYRRAFPADERKPFLMILRAQKKGRMEVWRVNREGAFSGFAITIAGQDHVLVHYLAVAESARGSGIGSEILQWLRSHYAGKGVFLEIESVWEDAPNQAQRLRRKHFYEKCGMESMGLFVWLFGIKMELMGFGCKLNFEEYTAFYRDYDSPWVVKHIRKAEK